jgi:membrane protease YdiL (CAAX protease family)
MTAYALPRDDARALHALLAICAGGVLLLSRAQAVALGAARTGALVVLYGALAAVSLRSPAPTGRGARLPAAPVAVAGIVAVLAIALAPWQVGPTLAYGASAAVMGTVAALAEEAFFRRLMYGWLERWWGALAAVVLSAGAFALVHVPLYGASVLWVDLGAGLLLSWQRWATGSWGPSAATHVAANLLVVVR